MNCNCSRLNGIYVPPYQPKEFNGVVIVGESPGWNETKEGKPFVGDSGQVLDIVLAEVGINREKCYITNVIKCYGEKLEKETVKECSKVLEKELKSIKNIKVIIALGGIATNFFVKIKSVVNETGKVYEWENGIPVVVSVHPAYVLRSGEDYLLYKTFNIAKRILDNMPLVPEPRFEIIEDLKEIKRFLDKNETLVLDIETTGLNARVDDIVSIAFANNEDLSKIYFSFWNDDIKEIFKSKNGKLQCIGHNFKFDRQFLRKEGIDVRVKMDTMLMHFVLEQHSSGLKKIVWKYCPEVAGYEVNVFLKSYSALSSEEKTAIKLYNSFDVKATGELYNTFLPLLNQKQLILLEDIYSPLTEAVSEMELNGWKVDVDKLDKWINTIENQILMIETDFKKSVGDYNLNSPKQLRELFTKLGLDSVIQRRTKTGEISTDVSALEELAKVNPELSSKILEYRRLTKLCSTYLKGIKTKLINDRVYPKYWIGKYSGEEGGGGTSTGRLSSTNPNAQNIPLHIREIFIPDNPNEVIIELDYKQIEVRVAGMLARDKNMAKYIQKEDFHRFVASKIFRKSYYEVTEEERKQAKSVTFGVLYGMGITTLAEIFGGDETEAKKFLKAYFKLFPDLKIWREEITRKGVSERKVTNIFGLTRYFDDTEDPTRMAINTPVQGTAGLICAWAVGRIHRFIKENNLNVKIKATVHDSIVLSVPEEELDYIPKIKELAENVYEVVGKVWDFTEIPFEVDVNVGLDWTVGKKTDYNLNSFELEDNNQEKGESND